MTSRRSKTVQTTTYWARVKSDTTAPADPKIGAVVPVELMLNDRSDPSSATKGRWAGGDQNAIYRGTADLTDGDIVLVQMTNLGLAIQPPGGGSGGGDCCCCEYVEQGETILTDGIETTRKREFCKPIGPIVERQAEGILTITFPPPEEMLLVRETADPPSDRFIYDIPSGAFSAVNYDGDDVTDSMDSPSGSVIFEHHVSGSGYNCDCPVMLLEIEWDADIPAPYGGYGY